MMPLPKKVEAVCPLLLMLLCGDLTALAGDPVIDWTRLMVDAIRTDNSGPTLGSRNLAMMHVAIYDAMNAVEQTHQPYLPNAPIAKGVAPEGAVMGAAYSIFVPLYPSQKANADVLYRTWRDSTPQTEPITGGLELGVRVAELVLAQRAADGASVEIPYIPSEAPGQWRRTPPFFRPPAAPHWGHVLPFGIDGVESFVPMPPPALSSSEYALSLNEVQKFGNKTSSSRTPEQTLSAVFWSDFSYTSTPPGHWQLLASNIAERKHNSLFDNARLFALLSIAQADAGIVCWECKYRYNLWRPITAIQRADEDDNQDTTADPSWDHFLVAPPFPSYPSGHSTFSKASAQILTEFYGTDSMDFEATSDSLPGLVKQYQSLAQCADEIGKSRIYGGIHYEFDNAAGKAAGKAIAKDIFANRLLPNSVLPFLRIFSGANATVLLQVQSRVGTSFVVETSTDLITWNAIEYGIGRVGGAYVQTAAPVSSKFEFFRVKTSD